MKMYSIPKLTHTFDPNHNGAPYFVPTSNKWMNAGEYKEVCLATAFQVNAKKDSVAYDKGSDIELEDGRNISVKSYLSTLTELITMEDNDEQAKQDIMRIYLDRTYANVFCYVIENEKDEKKFTVVEMDIYEWDLFMERFGKLIANRQKTGYKMRFGVVDSKVKKWAKEFTEA